MHPLVEFRRLADLLIVRDRPDHDIDWILWQLRAIYREVPGLALTIQDVQETFQLNRDTCDAVLGALTAAGFLRPEGDVLLLSS